MAQVQELPKQAERVPQLYMAMIIILGVAFLATLGSSIYWEFTETQEVPAWMISLTSATGGGLLGALLPQKR